MTQYTFLQENKNITESIISDFLKRNSMCDRAQILRENTQTMYFSN